MCITLRHHKVHPPHPHYEGYEPRVQYGPSGPRRAGFHTSGTEILHLIVAVVVLTVAFGFFLGGVSLGEDGLTRRGGGLGLADAPLADLFIVAFVAIGSGFILHELMHKFVAQFYGHWAEFRAQMVGLLIPIPLVLFLGFIFAAPGAVVISGFVRKHENGIISAAGPGTNIVIALIALPFTMQRGTVDTLTYQIAEVSLLANAFLALFNLLPFGPLDGKKVLAWNKPVYLLLVAASIFMLYLGLA